MRTVLRDGAFWWLGFRLRFYYEVRTEPEMIARRNWTQAWWDRRRHAYLLMTSVAVIDELQAGTFPNKDQM